MRPFTLLFLTITCLTLPAEIEVQTSIKDVYHRGAAELAGGITLHVKADELAEASPTNPLYLRIALDQNAVLAQTLVNLNARNVDVSLPIFLAAELASNTPGNILNMPVDTLSVVRWVAGDDAIWIRVQRSSSSWVRLADLSSAAPSPDDQVHFSIGVSARSSADDHDITWPIQKSNLPYNTRNPDAADIGDPGLASSTLICVDLHYSLLLLGERLRVLFDAYGPDAEILPGIYVPGTVVPIVFSNDEDIARGKDRSCSAMAIAFPLDSPGTTLVANLVTVTRKFGLSLV